ncbi:ABC transporter ATP-binding protein [Gracilibacillus marinus]|uniref:ABC transporter ATP-binding protein n=1 Tax=Gracilibacillus marinus TaxID=630535 RepID=A0ABV8VVY8_9BACI
MVDIQIQQLTKRYGKKRGIEDINLTLPSGGLTAVVGPSGCGKTTLLRTLAGFHQPDEGNVYFGERDVTKLSPQKRNAAMVFQQYALWPHMSVYDNINYGLKLKKVPVTEQERKVYEILRRIEIDVTDVKERYPQQYSGGQQQRIALARALVVQPDVMLLDEPLSNLDAKVRQRLRVEIREIQQAFGITAVYVTHDQEEALSMADYIIIMNNGQVEQAGTPKEVYENPKSLFAAQFLGESHTIQFQLNSIDKQMVVRSDESALIPLQASPDNHPTYFEDETYYYLYGKVNSYLYMGSYYRYMIEVNDESIFVDSNEIIDSQMCKVKINKNNAHVFDVEKKEAHIIV